MKLCYDNENRIRYIEHTGNFTVNGHDTSIIWMYYWRFDKDR